jgi:hypothetical protein
MKRKPKRRKSYFDHLKAWGAFLGGLPAFIAACTTALQAIGRMLAPLSTRPCLPPSADCRTRARVRAELQCQLLDHRKTKEVAGVRMRRIATIE